MWCSPPLSQYVPHDDDRAPSPEGDDKARYTSFLYGAADGRTGPSYNIVRFASSNPFNLSGTRVIQKFYRDSLTSSLGWTFKFWERAMMMPAKYNCPL